MKISPQEQIISIKQYLGFFFTPITKEDISKFKKLYPSFKSLYVYHTPEELKKIGMYLLLLRGNEKYKLYNAYDLFNNYIGRNEDSKEWLDTTTPVIILYYPAYTEQNKKIQDILGHLISHRHTFNKVTIFLSESEIPYIHEIYRSFENSKSVNINISANKTITQQSIIQTKSKKDPLL